MINFKSRSTIKILDYFFLNRDQEKYATELASILEEDVNNLRKKLVELTKDGLLLSRQSGRQVYYSLNKKYPFLKEMIVIHHAKYGIEKELGLGLKKIPGVKEAYLFGSFVTKQMRADSDIDLLVVGTFSENELSKLTTRLQKRTGREINAVEMSEKEYVQKKKSKNELLTHIFSNPYLKLV